MASRAFNALLRFFFFFLLEVDGILASGRVELLRSSSEPSEPELWCSGSSSIISTARALPLLLDMAVVGMWEGKCGEGSEIYARGSDDGTGQICGQRSAVGIAVILTHP